ncbi:MAG: ABC transporter substrate-binding protein [Slackia sp.]|nr:ABC transporter substrate-binding protein [Slackia sp.]
MRKLSALLLAAACMMAALAGCAAQPEAEQPAPAPEENTVAEPVAVNAAALKGPTAMGLVKFMSDAESGAIADNDYSFEIAASPDELTPRIAKGELDIAAVPANLASVLYNNTDKGVQVLAVNTLGVLYVCDQDGSVNSVADLAGKTIYASGKGSTPEYALNYILEKNGLTPGVDVQVEWKSEHAECVAAMAQDPQAIALLPQPFVTTAQAKNEAIRPALDLTEEWEAVQEDSEESSLITGVVIARAEFVQEHPEAVEAFLGHYKESVEFVNGDVAAAAELVGSYDIVPAPVAEKAIPACNIVCIDGAEMKEKLSGYLGVLFEQNPKAVGGELPGDDFYYGA